MDIVSLTIEPEVGDEAEELLLASATVYKQKIAGPYKDPLTLPKIRVKCIKKKYGICVEWATKYKYLYVKVYVVVTTTTPADVQSAVHSCLRQSAVAAALSAAVAIWISSGVSAGKAATATFTAVLTKCLKTKLKDVAGVEVKTETDWGEWE